VNASKKRFEPVSNTKSPVAKLAPYLESLKGLLAAQEPPATKIALALDGGPGFQLRQHLSPEERRTAGTFFTGAAFASQLALSAVSTARKRSVFIDPACGAGDLLLACARELPTKRDPLSTLEYWGGRLIGYDIEPLLVDMARVRLGILAKERCAKRADISRIDLRKALPFIKVGSGTEPWEIPHKDVVVVTNPPFGYRSAPENCDWASGRICQAAHFIERCLSQTPQPQTIFAILPEVVRSGSRYARWRDLICRCASIRNVETLGLFDSWTDVDVFSLELSLSSPVPDRKGWHIETKPYATTLGTLFNFHIGPVVPYRHKSSGTFHPFLVAKNLPTWSDISATDSRIRTKTRLFKPPFIIVRRTSRPGDRNRAVGSTVIASEEVAVENHLIVAKPKDERLATCRRVLESLRDPRTNQWLDERIRCRHLTIQVLEELPIWGAANE
jgi:hypothetical protein